MITLLKVEEAILYGTLGQPLLLRTGCSMIITWIRTMMPRFTVIAGLNMLRAVLKSTFLLKAVMEEPAEVTVQQSMFMHTRKSHTQGHN